MSARIGTVQVPDDEWEDAAIEQLRTDIRAYPGGLKAFHEQNSERLGIGYYALNDNLTGKSRIAYRTFSRAVHVLGFTTSEYDERINQLVESKRRQAERE